MGGLQAQSAPVVNTGWVPDWRALEATKTSLRAGRIQAEMGESP